MTDGYEVFERDLAVAVVTEREVAEMLKNIFESKIISYNDDNKYDILMENIDGLTYSVEVKEDFTCERTGNIGLEYSCRGKDSGIRVSQADYYCFKAHKPDGKISYLLIATSVLKSMIKDKKYHRTVNGGDPGSNSLNYLFDYEVIAYESYVINRGDW